MRPFPKRRSTLRCARFERVEDRVVLSGLAEADVCWPTLPELAQPGPDSSELTALAALQTAAQRASSVRDTYGFSGRGQTVAVIDSGIAYEHQAFGPDALAGGWDFTEEQDADPHDDGPAGFHGTHVAGIIASRDDAHPGLAPDVDLVGLRVFNDSGQGYLAWVEQALQWVHTHRDDYRYPITTVNLSLGMAWNSDQVPSWGTLEDELALLKQDGIWVTVASGNSFAQYGQTGLSYPAASPYVVPVASVGNDGTLSDFGQRTSRVLAAPGEQIVSAVPDHVFGADGDFNDWAAASGTSMAAPYVAGAGVLVREAMQFVQTASIDTDSIYQTLYTTADPVFDSVTEQVYRRVNLERAIHSLMPADDYGSTLAGAGDLGTLVDRRSATGRLTRLDDTDLFQFTAGRGGRVELAVDATEPIVVGVGTSIATAGASGALDLATDSAFDVAAGETYTILVSADRHVSDYRLQLRLEEPEFLQVAGGHVTVQGTAGNDLIEITVGLQWQVSLNGRRVQLPAGSDWQVEVRGGAGRDALQLTGSTGSDEVWLHADRTEMRGLGYQLQASEFERVIVEASGGRDDVARFYDSAGNDELIARPTSVELHVGGVINEARGFDRVYAYASNGADDVARFFDSAGNDRFSAHSEYAVMRGAGYYNKAAGFDRTYAYASEGRDDVAKFFGSADNDRLDARPQQVVMTGAGYYNKAMGFDRTYATAGGGLDDVAHLGDSPTSDLFVGRPDSSYLRGAGFYNKVIGFERVYAVAGRGPDDVARLFDSAGDDLFYGNDRAGVLRGTGFYLNVEDFNRVYVRAVSGGNDVARLSSPQGPARLSAWTGRQVFRTDQFYFDVRSFDQVYAQGSGAGDVVQLFNLPDIKTRSLTADRALWATPAERLELTQFDYASAVDYLFSL